MSYSTKLYSGILCIVEFLNTVVSSFGVPPRAYYWLQLSTPVKIFWGCHFFVYAGGLIRRESPYGKKKEHRQQ